MDAAYLGQKFAVAKPYHDYVKSGTPEQQRRWQAVYDAGRLTPAQSSLVATFTRRMKVLVVSGVWCGDCIEQLPLLQRITEANPGVLETRFVDRDEHKDLSSQLSICGGVRVPVALFLAEDDELCSSLGDRVLARYRALAARQLGPSCSTGLVVPPDEEIAETLQDWLNEAERVQLMLRLSGRLRQKHND